MKAVNCLAFWALLFSFLDLAVIVGVTKRDSWQSSFYAPSSHCNDVGVKDPGFLWYVCSGPDSTAMSTCTVVLVDIPMYNGLDFGRQGDSSLCATYIWGAEFF